MIDIHKFVSEWNGRYNNEDGAYGPQCVDLAKQWEKENGWTISHGNAIDYAKGEVGFTWHANTPTGVPPVGALVVFQTGTNGHIGIALPGSSAHALVLFQQNDPLGSVCHVKTYDYVHPKCLGWLVHNG